MRWAHLGALPLRRAPILDPLHRRANLVCSPNVINSRVAALNRNCQLGLGAGRVRLWKRLGVQGAPPNSPYASAPICHVSAHVLVMGASFAATGSTELCARRFLHLLATAAYRREALEQLRAMSGMRAHDHAVFGVARALGARLLLRRTVGLPRKNVDLLVAYLGSKVELARDLGCSEHLTAMFYCVV